MMSSCRKVWSRFTASLRRFGSDGSGQIVIIFALASTAIVVAVGSGIDLSRAYVARQKLSEVATLTCQFANRSSIVATANTTYGPCGVKFWIFKRDVLTHDPAQHDRRAAEQAPQR